MKKITETIKDEKLIIGMIHVPALPGTPSSKMEAQQIIEHCVEEAIIYKQNGLKALGIENMHDRPYLKRTAGPEITSMMSVIGYEIKKETGLYCGVQILAGANKQALAAAQAGGLDFIRAEGFVFGHIADEGLIESDAGELLRYRKQIGAENISIFTDIKKKHSSHKITEDVDISETAEAAEFFLSDGLVITGSSTGKPASLSEIMQVKKNSTIPVMVGSGVDNTNIKSYLNAADAVIVGSYFKKDGNWANEIDPERIKQLLDNID